MQHISSNYDEVIDEIIRLEGNRYHSIKIDSEVENKPSYFKHLKKIYFKEWQGLYNPNNIFIPFILISIEAVLRQMVECDEKKTALNYLDILLGKKSPLFNVPNDVEYIAWKKIPESDKVIFAGSAKEKSGVQYLIDILISQKIVASNSDLIIRPNNKNAYKQRLYTVLESIRDKYYSKGKNNDTFRNKVMHANMLLIMIDDNVFAELLSDYRNLLNASWLDPVIQKSQFGESELT